MDIDNTRYTKSEADFKKCPFRILGAVLLRLKSRNFLSFVDSRRNIAQKTDSVTYTQVASVKKSDFEKIQKILESRTNIMFKILVEYSSKQSDKIMESINVLSILITNFLAKT